MESTKQLAARLKEVLINGKWVAQTNYKEKLEDISWEEAVEKVGDLNTIAALAFHINYYLEGVLHFFNEGKLEIRDKYSFDVPPIRSAPEWEDLRNNFLTNSESFVDYVSNMPDSQLEDVFLDEKYGTYRRNIEGMIEHCYYHLGQISLIRKMINSNKP